MTVANPAPLDRPATGRPRFPTDADGLLVTPHRPPDGGPAWALAFEGLDPLDWPDQGGVGSRRLPSAGSAGS